MLEVAESPERGYEVWETAPRRALVAVCGFGPAGLKSARIVAASSEMLAALELAEELFVTGIKDAPLGMYSRVITMRRDAIKLATGVV